MTFPSIGSQAWLEAADDSKIPLPGNCSIGRSSDNLVHVQSERASRRHATIHAQEGEYWLIDLGSSNGTYLNGHRVQLPMRLNDTDVITIAGHRFSFRQEKAADTTPETLSGGTLATMQEIRSEFCWLLLADIIGFTPLSQKLSPEELAIIVGQWVRKSRDILAANGGALNKYLGDGYMAYWHDHADSVHKVAGAIQALQVQQAAASPPFRLVVHYGRVALGGSASMGEESLMGPEVNYVFRVEKLAGSLDVAVALSESARERLYGVMDSDPVLGEHELKGFPGTHKIYRLRGAK